MLFISTQDNLVSGLSGVAPLAGRNTQLAALSHVLCRVKEGALELTATDLEVGAKIVVAGKAESDGSCTVVARTLFDYVQQLPKNNPINFELKDKVVMVSTEGFQANFPVGEVDDFPLLPTVVRDMEVSLDAKAFSEALNGVIYSAARDMTRPEIHSVLVAGEGQEVRLAATDSFRLSEEILKLETSVSEFSLLLPLTAAQEVVRLFSGKDKIVLYPQESHVTFQGDGIEFTSRLIEGKYPDYKQIIPKSHKVSGLVDRSAMLQALKTLLVFLPKDSRRLKCSLDPEDDKLTLSVGGDKGEGEVVVNFQGEGGVQEVYFNIQYLLEGMQHLPGEQVEIKCGSANDPALMAPVKAVRDSLYVVMPIQA